MQKMFNIKISDDESRKTRVILEQKGNTASYGGKGSGQSGKPEKSGARDAYNQLMQKGK